METNRAQKDKVGDKVVLSQVTEVKATLEERIRREEKGGNGRGHITS